jgi:hypothetical protein
MPGAKRNSSKPSYFISGAKSKGKSIRSNRQSIGPSSITGFTSCAVTNWLAKNSNIIVNFMSLRM